MPAAHLLDYLESEFATFAEKPFRPADSAVLAQLAMVHVERVFPDGSPAVRPRDLLLAERFGDLLAGLDPERDRRALFAAAASPRFRTLEISGARSVFDPARETQFAALTFTCPGSFSYVAFRGTDASFTGWNEDFNMGWMWPVPGQAEAVRYLEEAAARHRGPLVVGGHSKGGNLAVYATVKARPDVQGRVVLACNHDGPGFRDGAFTEAEYAAVADRVHKTVPQESVVGVLLENRDDFGVVRSAGRGVDQHSLYNWEIDLEAGDFVYADRLAETSVFWRATMRRWVETSTVGELECIVDALFRTLDASGEDDAAVILGGGPRAVASLLDVARSVDPRDRAVLRKAFGSLGSAAARTLGNAKGRR